ncbi:hypothetical protein G6F43_012377 [Rhizopus delemar]|nr:hypothetical protein G6F43_012377 [Rhizopus delemar]
MSQAAYFLLTVMSLQGSRTIILNFKKLEIICEAGLRDSVDFLAQPLGGKTSDVFFKSNSPLSSQDSEESTSSEEDSTNSKNNWMEVEQARRALKLIDDKMKGISFDDDVLTCEDWEDIVCFKETDV